MFQAPPTVKSVSTWHSWLPSATAQHDAPQLTLCQTFVCWAVGSSWSLAYYLLFHTCIGVPPTFLWLSLMGSKACSLCSMSVTSLLPEFHFPFLSSCSLLLPLLPVMPSLDKTGNSLWPLSTGNIFPLSEGNGQGLWPLLQSLAWPVLHQGGFWFHLPHPHHRNALHYHILPTSPMLCSLLFILLRALLLPYTADSCLLFLPKAFHPSSAAQNVGQVSQILLTTLCSFVTLRPLPLEIHVL